MLHHPYCKNSDCKVCLEDHLDLASIIEARIPGLRIDYLGKYATFMNMKLGRKSETEYGWGDPLIFNDYYIEDFVEELKRIYLDA